MVIVESMLPKNEKMAILLMGMDETQAVLSKICGYVQEELQPLQILVLIVEFQILELLQMLRKLLVQFNEVMA